MGLLGNLFGKGKEYPPLDAGSAAAKRIERFRGQLEGFASKVNDRLELIPTDSTLYAFVGKPPDAFGVVWWRDGEEHNFKTLMKAKALPQTRIQLLSDELRDSYKRHAADERFSSTVAGKQVTVTPSEAFAADVEKIIHEVN